MGPDIKNLYNSWWCLDILLHQYFEKVDKIKPHGVIGKPVKSPFRRKKNGLFHVQLLDVKIEHFNLVITCIM